MHIALFGGAFDPPHRGHQKIARILVQQRIVDEVWFVPLKKHPFDKQVSIDFHRLAMLEIQVKDHETQKIETYELQQPGKSYSYSTLQHFQKKFPQHAFCWVIGSDNVEKFQYWFSAQELLNMFRVYVYPRQGSENVTILTGMSWIEGVEPVNFSSTSIRQKIQKGESIHGLVDPDVERYIKENGLYR